MSLHDCKAFRAYALELGLEARGVEPRLAAPGAAGAPGAPGAACAACAAWLRRHELEIGLLESLERLVAPAALSERVEADLARILARDLAPDRSPDRWARALGDLPRVAAPAALDELVHEIVQDHVTAAAADEVRAGEVRAGEVPDVAEPDSAVSPVRQALSSLPQHKAPDVLARLVAEELEEGSRATARRSVRELERQAAPRTLARRLESSGAFDDRSSSRRPRFARAFAPLAAAGLALVGLAAAALVLFDRAAERDPLTTASSGAGAALGFEERLAAEEWDAATSRGERALEARGIQVRRLDDLSSVGPALQSMVAAFAGPFHDPAERPIAPARALRDLERKTQDAETDSAGRRDSTLGDPSNRIQDSLRRDVGPTRSQG